MASGDLLSSANANNTTRKSGGYRLLDAVNAAGDGPWVDVKVYNSTGSIEVFGTFDATIEIRVSNQDALPAKLYAGARLNMAITAPGIMPVGMNVRWMKAVVTRFASGNVSAFYHSSTP